MEHLGGGCGVATPLSHAAAALLDHAETLLVLRRRGAPTSLGCRRWPGTEDTRRRGASVSVSRDDDTASRPRRLLYAGTAGGGGGHSWLAAQVTRGISPEAVAGERAWLDRSDGPDMVLGVPLRCGGKFGGGAFQRVGTGSGGGAGGVGGMLLGSPAPAKAF